MKDADTAARRWIEARRLTELHLTATVVYEIARGVERLPAGRRRAALARLLERELLPLLDGRILPLDAEAALAWARLAGDGERHGRLPPTLDCQIAAVAIRHGMTVVTLDRRGFASLGCALHVLPA
jgi:predicted nucleic acid-binding protein